MSTITKKSIGNPKRAASSRPSSNKGNEHSKRGRQDGGTGAPPRRSLHFTVDQVFERIQAAVKLDLSPWASPTLLYGEYQSPEDSRALYCRRQIDEIHKRYIPSTTKSSEIRRATIDAFLANQKRLVSIRGGIARILHNSDRHNVHVERGGIFKDRLFSQYQHVPCEGAYAGVALYRILRRARLIVQSVLGNLDEIEIIDGLANGTGATFGVPYQDTSDVRKLTLPITGTTSASTLLRRFISEDPLLREAVVSSNLGTAPHTPVFAIYQGSKFGVVPKNSRIGRGIVPSLTANGLGQQSIGRALIRRLRAVGLDLMRLQEYHRDHARDASLSGALFTWDGRNASDNWVTPVVEWLIGTSSGWLWWMNQFREPVVDIDGRYLQLETYATMGNAYCFPLETLLFWAIACSSHQESTVDKTSEVPTWYLYGDVSVYGDDVMGPSESYETYRIVIEALGHETNHLKSHFAEDDPFRESCGFDAFLGENIRPIAPEAPSNRKGFNARRAWLFNVFNQLFERYISYFGAGFLFNSCLFRAAVDIFLIERMKVFIVPSDFPEDSGLRLVTPNLQLAVEAAGGVVAQGGYDAHMQCRLQPFLSWKGTEEVDTPDPVRLWRRRHEFAVHDGEGWAPKVHQSRDWFSDWVGNMRLSDIRACFKRYGADEWGPLGGYASCEIRPGPTRNGELRALDRLYADTALVIFRNDRKELGEKFPSINWKERERCLELYAVNLDSMFGEKLRFRVQPGPVVPTTTWVDRRKGSYTVAFHFN